MFFSKTMKTAIDPATALSSVLCIQFSEPYIGVMLKYVLTCMCKNYDAPKNNAFIDIFVGCLSYNLMDGKVHGVDSIPTEFIKLARERTKGASY